MAAPRKQLDPEAFDELRRVSGWYLAAWRAYRNLSQQELADEVGTSKGYVGDLEKGAIKKNGSAVRFNRDNVDEFARALGVTPGFLLDVNPYRVSATTLGIVQAMEAMDEPTRAQILRMVSALDPAA